MARHPVQVMRCAIKTLYLRQIQHKIITDISTKRSLGALWMLVEPMLHVGVWVIIKGVLHGGWREYNLPLPIFIFLGFIPWLVASNVIGKSLNAINFHKGLFVFRQIKIIDTTIAIVLAEMTLLMIVCIIMLIGFWWINLNWTIYHPFLLIIILVVYTWFLMSLSLTLAILSFFFKSLSKIISICMRFLYLSSGIFFTAKSVPFNYQIYIETNPIYQVINSFRNVFVLSYENEIIISITYLAKISFILSFASLVLYSCYEKKIMTEFNVR